MSSTAVAPVMIASSRALAGSPSWAHTRAKTLTAGECEVAGELIHEVARACNGFAEATLDDLEPRLDTGLEVGSRKIRR